MGGYTNSHRRTFQIGADTLGTSAQSVNSTVTSNAIDTDGYSQLTVHIDYTYSAGTALTMYVEATNAMSSAPTWRRTKTSALSSGTYTMSNALWSLTVSAANQAFPISVAVDDYKAVRLVFAMTGSPDASDVITVNATLGA